MMISDKLNIYPLLSEPQNPLDKKDLMILKIVQIEDQVSIMSSKEFKKIFVNQSQNNSFAA